MEYNVSFVTDTAVITTSVRAEDEGDAHDFALDVIREDLGLNLIPIRYQIEIEEID